MTFWLRFGLIAIAAAAIFFAGHKVARLQCRAAQAEALEAANAARKVDEARVDGISTAYEAIAAQLRRMSSINRSEVIRETQKVEYRCLLPADGERLRLDAVRAANTAAGQPDPTLPADPPDSR